MRQGLTQQQLQPSIEAHRSRRAAAYVAPQVAAQTRFAARFDHDSRDRDHGCERDANAGQGAKLSDMGYAQRLYLGTARSIGLMLTRTFSAIRSGLTLTTTAIGRPLMTPSSTVSFFPTVRPTSAMPIADHMTALVSSPLNRVFTPGNKVERKTDRSAASARPRAGFVDSPPMVRPPGRSSRSRTPCGQTKSSARFSVI
jgi:hypothetical protein